MVAILDAWTSPRGRADERREVFGVGETIQFNGVFVTERETLSRVRILFIVDSLSNFVAADDGYLFEIAFKPQSIFEAEFTVGPEAQHSYASFEIPETTLRFDWRGRRETAFELASGGFNYIFAPTLYSFRVMVRLLDVATGISFDLSNGWAYGITR